MNSSSRFLNSGKNLLYGLASQFITMILNFMVRTVFIKYLGIYYLGVNGLFTNILTVLSLAELGFGTAMVYSMYKPLAVDDKKKLQALMKLYSRVYFFIGLIVVILGISIIPFMDYIISDKPNIDNITMIYLLFLANSVSSYFFAFKRSILNADQKAFINSRYSYIFSAVKAVLQIGVLVLFQNYIVFLLIQLFITVAENLFVSKKVDKMYPYIHQKHQEKLSRNELKKIKEDIKALTLSNIGRVALNGSDNIIISAKLGVGWVGLLSNYTLITGTVIMVISQVTTAITGSVGNFIANENRGKQFELFKSVDFIHYWLYGFSTICLFILLNPFIVLWIGGEYKLSWPTVLAIALNFLVNGLLTSLWTFRTTMGLFVQGKYRPIIAAIINIVVSIILADYFGLLGVLLGTTIARVLVNVWYDPYIIFKYGFNKSAKAYYINYIIRLFVLCFTTLMIYMPSVFILNLNVNVTIAKFIVLMFITLTVPNIVFYILYRNTNEFKYLLKQFNHVKVRMGQKMK